MGQCVWKILVKCHKSLAEQFMNKDVPQRPDKFSRPVVIVASASTTCERYSAQDRMNVWNFCSFIFSRPWLAEVFLFVCVFFARGKCPPVKTKTFGCGEGEMALTQVVCRDNTLYLQWLRERKFCALDEWDAWKLGQLNERFENIFTKRQRRLPSDVSYLFVIFMTIEKKAWP